MRDDPLKDEPEHKVESFILKFLNPKNKRSKEVDISRLSEEELEEYFSDSGSGGPILWMFLGFVVLFGLAQLVIWFPWLWPMW